MHPTTSAYEAYRTALADCGLSRPTVDSILASGRNVAAARAPDGSVTVAVPGQKVKVFQAGTPESYIKEYVQSCPESSNGNVPTKVYATSMDPILAQGNPELGTVVFRPQRQHTEILTQHGVRSLSEFNSLPSEAVCCGLGGRDNNSLLPPFPPVPYVPLTFDGTLDQAAQQRYEEEYLNKGRAPPVSKINWPNEV
ncbi:MAG: uncharacterized protein KVP18_004129 [Porospora cf. gigantea A]|nr:MAG: hypothetical protein KVP18_004129 [Porospora cf. gigantea A]